MKLPKTSNLFVNTEPVVAGFGYESIKTIVDSNNYNRVTHGGSSTGILKFAQTNVITNERCAVIERDPVYSSHICARVKQRDRKKPEGTCVVGL